MTLADRTPSRAGAVDALVDAAAIPGRVAVVRGRPGTGRTTVVDTVAGRLVASGLEVLTLRGRSGLPEGHHGAAATPSAWPGPGGVVVVDDADHLGEVAAAVLGSLVAEGTVTAVVAVADQPLPVAITGLLRLTDPVTVELAPLDADGCAAVARRELGGPVAPDLGRELVRVTGGLPGAVVEAVRSWRDRGVLVQQRSLWTADAELPPVAPGPTDLLAGTEAVHRTALEICAVAGQVPLDGLEALVGEPVLVELEGAGAIEVVGDAPDERIRLRVPALRSHLLDGLDADRRREVVGAVLDLVDPDGTGSDLTDQELLDVNLWRLELHGALDAADALRAAAAGLRVGNHRAASRFAAIAWNEHPSTASAVVHADALRATGDHPAALDVLTTAWALEDGAVPRGMLAAAVISAHLHTHEDPWATGRLAADLTAALTDDHDRAAVRAAAAYVAALAGHAELAADLLDRCRQGQDADRAFESVHRFVDLVTRVLSGRSLAGWERADPTHPQPAALGPLGMVDACDLFSIFHDVWRSDPRGAADAAARLALAARERNAVLTEGWAAWIEGCALLVLGRLTDAQRCADRAWRCFAPLGLDSRLRAVTSQLHAIDALLHQSRTAMVGSAHVHPPTAAGTDDSGGSSSPALVARDLDDDLPAGTLWFFRAEQLHFAALAEGVEDGPGAGARLLGQCPGLLQRGMHVGAVVAEVEAMVLGHAPGGVARADEVLRTARQLDADLAIGPSHGHRPNQLPPLTAMAAAARALVADDGPDLVSTVRALVDAGFLVYAHLALRAALAPDRELDRADRSELVELAGAVAAVSDLRPAGVATVGLDRAPFTPGEREVVRAALEGGTNREIAEAVGRSKRTVDNLLASAYRKVGVTSREALAVLLIDAGTPVVADEPPV